MGNIESLGKTVVVSLASISGQKSSNGFASNMSLSTPQYNAKQLVQNQHSYNIIIRKSGELTSDGNMAFKFEDNNYKIRKIQFVQVSKYSSAFYKKKQSKDIHAGLILENNFLIESTPANLSFRYCLIHLYANDHEIVIKMEFKNDSNFKSELGAVIGSTEGFYSCTQQMVAHQNSTAVNLATFINTIINNSFDMQNFNCCHFVALSSFLLKGDTSIAQMVDYEVKFNEWKKSLPQDIQQMSPI